ncbi:MAG: ATP synthase F1 subunit epsilon [Alphaproteobacteria bacterium]|nr:ATP synthase F1 subunit epsilon [Alphaproteobacteria bacterium]
MGTFSFSLVSPEKVLLEQDVSMVVIPGLEGDIGVLPGHAPLLTLLRPGVVKVYEEEKILVKIFVDGGFSEITPERCMTLVTEGIPLESLDKASLEIEIKNLLEDLNDSQTAEERKEADRNLEISRAKLLEIMAYQKAS